MMRYKYCGFFCISISNSYSKTHFPWWKVIVKLYSKIKWQYTISHGDKPCFCISTINNKIVKSYVLTLHTTALQQRIVCLATSIMQIQGLHGINWSWKYCFLQRPKLLLLSEMENNNLTWEHNSIILSNNFRSADIQYGFFTFS